MDDSEDKGQKVPKFKGLISIGVDELSNTLVVSAPAYLLETIDKMVLELDEAAKPKEEMMTVVKIGSEVGAAQVEESISRLFGQGGKNRAPRGKPAEQPQAKPADKGHNGSGNHEQPHNGTPALNAQMR